MRSFRILACGALTLVGLWSNLAQAGHGGWSVGVRIGDPFCYRPWYGYGYYRPYPVYVAPGPIYVTSPPVIQQVPVQTVVQPVYQAPAPPVVAHSANADGWQIEVDRHLQLLADPNDRVRADSALQLGRLKAQSAIDPLAATLAGDRNPEVREAAARSLGLIGSMKALPALQHAAQADTDRDVRHSAQFAVDVVQSYRQ
jgi:hypothetical protein